MCRLDKIALVVVNVILDAFVYSQDCIYKECTCDNRDITCEAKHLTKMPTLTSNVLFYETLSLDSNSITDIPAGSLPPGLSTLYLMENPTTSIAEMAFNGSVSTLENLYFSRALFTKVPDAFRHLRNLKLLNMQEANIEDWNEEAIKNIGQTLENLYLDKVGMTSWPTSFKYFTSLTEMTISGGSISSIPDDAFDNLNNVLNMLAIQNNELTEIPKALSKMTALQQLYLEQNKIVNIIWVPRRCRLTSLSLSNNYIYDGDLLTESIQQFGDSLVTFNINSNRLTSIPNITFLTLVGMLDLSENRIADPYSGDVASNVESINFNNNLLPAIPHVLKSLKMVTQLIMSSNSMTQIRASDMPASVTLVELEYNLITELTDNSFPSNSLITSLDLNYNPIIKISDLAFQNLGYLTNLNLQGTRLVRLPLALSSIRKLYLLDMSNSVNLICTCQEKGLQTWVLSMNGETVLGKCGLMDIYQFFSKLSPNCP